jgi:hypothetical protein
MGGGPNSLRGAFSDPSFITTDADKGKTDGYAKVEPLPDRFKGKGFKVTKPKKGHGSDVYFDKKIPTMAAADQNQKGAPLNYVDPGAIDRQDAKKAKEKNISTKDFKCVSYPKKSTGAGSSYGTLQGKPFLHEPEFSVQKRGVPSNKFEGKQQPNILTRPSKKGTYGMIGTTFGKIEAAKLPDNYDQMRVNDRAAWEKSKKLVIGTGNFKTTCRPKFSFDEKGNTGVPSAFDHYQIPEGKAKKSVKAPEKADDRPVFKYSSAPKSGEQGYMNKFPTKGDAPDPYDTLRQKQKKDRETGPKPLGGSWKPVNNAKGSVIKSLLKRYY